jgi:hypothetical protein
MRSEIPFQHPVGCLTICTVRMGATEHEVGLACRRFNRIDEGQIREENGPSTHHGQDSRMIASLPQFRERLDGTWLRARRAIALPIPESTESAFAVEIRSDDLDRVWNEAASLAEFAGRWPLVSATVGTGRGPDWASAIRAQDFFCRFEYTLETGRETAPEAIVRAADGVVISAFLLQLDIMRRQQERELAELFSKRKGANSLLLHEVDCTNYAFGSAPSADTVFAGIGQDNASNRHMVERYLMRWESERWYRWDPSLARMPWFDLAEHGYLVLLFLPVRCSWDALAYLHWFGAERFPTSSAIALGRHWQRLYGAELVAHYGTMLQCVVARPPSNPESAWPLACEHDLFSPGTLAPSGTRVRHYAQGLVGHDRWFFHDRP